MPANIFQPPIFARTSSEGFFGEAVAMTRRLTEGGRCGKRLAGGGVKFHLLFFAGSGRDSPREASLSGPFAAEALSLASAHLFKRGVTQLPGRGACSRPATSEAGGGVRVLGIGGTAVETSLGLVGARFGGLHAMALNFGIMIKER